MDILPILSTLKRHKTAAALIVLQIALTCAIVCNALFLISQRVERIQTPTGMPDDEIVTLFVTGVTRAGNAEAQTQSDLALLRGLPGVSAVALTNQLPFGPSSHNSGVRLQPGDNTRARLVASHYSAGEGWLQALGLRLAEGRDFLPEEYLPGTVLDDNPDPRVPAVIITRAMAEQLFPGQSALGQALYIYGTEPQRVVGVLEQLPPPYPTGVAGPAAPVMVTPLRPTYRSGTFVLRTTPPQRDALLKAASAALEKNSDGVKRIVRMPRSFADMREAYYRQDRAMVWLLGGVCVALLIVTAFGIVGLASFWVQQRTRMIGTRRALGATRGQILRYFQTENLLLSSAGIVLGMLGAYGISLLLMRHYELPRLPWHYLPLGALALWALGQIAVLAPARRAAALPPVAALRGA